jgi:hypothetical protein
MNIRVFSALLQDRRELRTATDTSGIQNGGRVANLAILAGIWAHCSRRLLVTPVNAAFDQGCRRRRPRGSVAPIARGPSSPRTGISLKWEAATAPPAGPGRSRCAALDSSAATRQGIKNTISPARNVGERARRRLTRLRIWRSVGAERPLQKAPVNCRKRPKRRGPSSGQGGKMVALPLRRRQRSSATWRLRQMHA